MGSRLSFPCWTLLEELKFWYSNIDSFNGYFLRPPANTSFVVFSDASDLVAFGRFSASLDVLTATGMFTSDDLGRSSTFPELKAIYYVLLSFADHLTHKRVKVFTDSQSAVRIMSIGSSKAHHHSVAFNSIFQFFLHGIYHLSRSGSPGHWMRELICSEGLSIKMIDLWIHLFSV